MGDTQQSDNWVFDCLVGFLRGPVWSVPVNTFIEHKSLGRVPLYFYTAVSIIIIAVFEPDSGDKNAEEYKKIHEDYKNLVRKLTFLWM